MKALKTIAAGGAALAALTVAAPAAAQYPGYGYGYGGGGDIIGQVLGTVLGGMIGSPGGYGGYSNPYGGYNSRYGYGSPYGGMGQSNQYAVAQCMGAVQQRLNAGYSGYSGYGGQQARVLGVSDVQRRSNGGTLVSGVANSGRSSAYGYGYNNGQPAVDLTFTCKTDSAGYVSSIEIGQAEYVNGQARAPAYTPYGNDYSRYGYSRY